VGATQAPEETIEHLDDEGYPTIPNNFTGFVMLHAVEIDGSYYLRHRFGKDVLYDYLDYETSYLHTHPGSRVFLNLAGHGYFNNNEVIAECDNEGQIIRKNALISQLSYEIRDRELKWIGIKNAKGEWADVAWGALRVNPSTYFPKFGNTHTVKVNGNYYLTHPLDKDTLFDYLDTEIYHLLEVSNEPTIGVYVPEDLDLKAPHSESSYPYASIDLHVADSTSSGKNYRIAGVKPLKNLQNWDEHTLAELRNNPQNYAGKCFIYQGSCGYASYVDMDVINSLLPVIEKSTVMQLELNLNGFFGTTHTDVVWGREYRPS
jgi:hypothetical protein